MEVDSENIQKKDENFNRNLRKRKKNFIDKRTVKHRTRKIKIFTRKSVRRHKSLEPVKKHDLSEKAQISLSSPLTTSLGSVIYLGNYRKIPQLITLDDSNDSVKNQNENKLQRPVNEDKSIKASSITFEETNNNSSNDIQNTKYLLDLVNEMCVGTTSKRTKKLRVRRGKN